MKRAIFILPLCALAAFGLLSAYELLKQERPGFGATAQRSAPRTAFPRLEGSGTLSFTPPSGSKPRLVNLFASWCAPCRAENPALLRLAAKHPGQVYGLAYKDSPTNIRAYLTELGNPYTDTGLDRDGQGGLDFGLTGVPESFLINARGQIVLHIRGPLMRRDIDAIEAYLRMPALSSG